MEKHTMMAMPRQQQMLTELTSANLPSSTKKCLALHFSGLKITNYEANDYKILYKFIHGLCNFIGVTEPPSKEITTLLLEHLKYYHDDFSKEEIQMAFGLATSGQLGFEFQHYNRLTPQLMSKTLNAYKVMRSRESIKLAKVVEDKRRAEEIENSKPTPEELRKRMADTCIRIFNSYKIEKEKQPEKRKEIIDFGNVCFNFLWASKCIKLTAKEIADIKLKSRQSLIEEKKKEFNEYDKKTVSKLIKAISEENSPILAARAKQISLEKYFDDLILFEVDIKKPLAEASKFFSISN